MSAAEQAYALGIRGLHAFLPLVARGSSKLARGVRGRRDAAERLVAWAREARNPRRPLVWFHAPSVGEGLQARAVLEAMHGLRSGLQAVFTHFSPSAEALAGRMPADVTGYLPWDVPSHTGAALDALRPAAVVFTKTEVWPVLSRQAAERGVPTLLVAATLPEVSSRLRWPTRAVLRPSMARLVRLCAIAPDDGERFVALGVSPERVAVTGDPGIDSAAERAAGADPEAPWIRPFLADPRPTLVAGSTWPADEEVLLSACLRARAALPRLRLIVAPHEPTPLHVGSLEGALARQGWGAARLSAVEARGDTGDADAVIVDRVGVLAHLYTVGEVAYVGGGFHDQGLHSVLEPAAAGKAVVFGPRHGNARAAGELVAAGGGAVVATDSELETALLGLVGPKGKAHPMGEAALRYIQGHRGAAGRTARIVLDHVAANAG